MLLFHNAGDIIADMGEKETTREPKDPTPEELKKMLSKNEAEMQEFFETTEDPKMKRIGTREEFKTKEPKEMPREGARQIKKEKGLDLDAYIKRWQEANSDYVLKNIDTSRVEIANMTGAEVPFEFVDYLISMANDSMESKDIHLLGKIKQVKIRLNRNTKELIIMAKDTEDTIGAFYFEVEPPFSLKKVESHLGIHTF